MKGCRFKEGNTFTGQSRRVSGKQQHFLQNLECPLLGGGVLPPILEGNRDVKTLHCGVRSETAGRRPMSRNIHQ